MAQIRSGTRLERYEVQEFLGRDALGTAYRGYDRGVARSVELLVLDGLASDEGRHRFESEAPRLVAFQHPRVVEAIGFGEYEAVPYMVYEFVGGGSLADVLRARRLDRNEALRILRAVAAAVDDAHRAGILHGDLNPDRVVIGPDGGAMVTDFGLAPMEEERPGPSPFTAPEQTALGAPTGASDRYSFAAIAYQVLSGSAPGFEQPAAGKPNPEPVLRPSAELGPSTYDVLRRGLASQPDRRWPSCAQIVEALDEALRADQAPVAAQPRRRGWVTALLAVLAVVLLAALGALIWNRTHQAPTPGISISDTSVPQGGSLIVSGSNLPPNQVGTVQLESATQQIGAFQADQNGNTTVRVTIPENTTPGGHVVSLCWDTCHASAKLTVTERAPTPSPSPPPTPSPSPTPTRAPPSPSPSATASAKAPSSSP